MSDTHHSTDRTDTRQPSTDRHQRGDAHLGTDAREHRGRGLLGRAATALAGLTGLGAASRATSASDFDEKRVLVVSRGIGHHPYTIMSDLGGTITPAEHADPGGLTPDERQTDTSQQHVEGHLWNWGVDSYTYTGKIHMIEAHGPVDVYFPDGGFLSPDAYTPDANNQYLTITGLRQGRHSYSVATRSGDVSLSAATTEAGDTSDGPSNTRDTPDAVSGHVRDTGSDGVMVDEGGVQRIRNAGHLRYMGL